MRRARQCFIIQDLTIRCPNSCTGCFIRGKCDETLFSMWESKFEFITHIKTVALHGCKEIMLREGLEQQKEEKYLVHWHRWLNGKIMELQKTVMKQTNTIEQIIQKAEERFQTLLQAISKIPSIPVTVMTCHPVGVPELPFLWPQLLCLIVWTSSEIFHGG